MATQAKSLKSSVSGVSTIACAHSLDACGWNTIQICYEPIAPNSKTQNPKPRLNPEPLPWCQPVECTPPRTGTRSSAARLKFCTVGTSHLWNLWRTRFRKYSLQEPFWVTNSRVRAWGKSRRQLGSSLICDRKRTLQSKATCNTRLTVNCAGEPHSTCALQGGANHTQTRIPYHRDSKESWHQSSMH